MRLRLLPLLAAATLIASIASGQQSAAPTPDRITLIKLGLKGSIDSLHRYEWYETTDVALKGETKATIEKRCYYGADGAVQKVEISKTTAGSGGRQPRGIRGKIVESKKEELSASMQEAVALVKSYVPPDPARIQAVKDAGKANVQLPDAKGVLGLVLNDYLKPGDSLTLTVDGATNKIRSAAIKTYTDSAKHAVTLDVDFASLADGTSYPAAVRLNVAEAQIGVTVKNAGYQLTGG